MPDKNMPMTMNSSANEQESNSNAVQNGSLTVQQRWQLHFRHVSYIVKQNKQTIKILNDICGEFQSGRLTAILGPSGAGKTSMLNVLSGFKAKGVTGEFILNGKPRDLLGYRMISSYIPQDFALLDLLTVQESIQVSADMKLPQKTTAEKHKIIDDILGILNMEKCRDNLVGTLSGGERKRLSIGIEMVTNPPLMFFDEPTSGLDSVASLQVINYLNRLARDGRIIVCVIHQPSSRLMQLFDDVFVMSHGEILYAGPQRHMLGCFTEAGYVFPDFYNPADFVLEVASEEPNAQIADLIEANKARHCHEISNVSNDANVNEKTKMLPTSTSTHTSIELHPATPNVNELNSNSKQILIRPKERVSFCRQFQVLIQRSFRTLSRNLIAVQLRILMHIMVAALLGAVFWNIGNDGARVLTNSSCFFFLALFIFFGNAMPSVLLCPQDTAVLIREYLNGWYSLPAYYLAKIVADLPMLFVCPTFYITIVYFMTGQPDDMARFAMCWGMSLLLAITSHFYGLVFGSTFDLQMAIFLVPGSCIPFMIFSGFFIRINELASVFHPICDISFFRYTMEGLMQAIYSFERSDLDCNVDFCYFKSPEKFLKELGMLGDLYGRDVLAMLIWIGTFQILFYFSLMRRIKKAQ